MSMLARSSVHLAPPTAPQRESPLRRIEFLVLVVLNNDESHGYGIVQQIEERTHGRVQVAPGNLYRVLDRMLERGLLVEAERRAADTASDERRRYYSITNAGRRVLAAEASLLRDIAAQAPSAAAPPAKDSA